MERQYADAFGFGFIPFAHKELYAAAKGEWHVFRVGALWGLRGFVDLAFVGFAV